MDSEYEDYNIDKILEDIKSTHVSDNAYNIYKACESSEEKLKEFVQLNLNLPIYNRFYKFYGEIIGYNHKDVPVLIIGITKKDYSIEDYSWQKLNDNDDVVLVRDLKKYVAYKYTTIYDIVFALESRNNEFILDF